MCGGGQTPLNQDPARQAAGGRGQLLGWGWGAEVDWAAAGSWAVHIGWSYTGRVRGMGG